MIGTVPVVLDVGRDVLALRTSHLHGEGIAAMGDALAVRADGLDGEVSGLACARTVLHTRTVDPLSLTLARMKVETRNAPGEIIVCASDDVNVGIETEDDLHVVVSADKRPRG